MTQFPIDPSPIIKGTSYSSLSPILQKDFSESLNVALPVLKNASEALSLEPTNRRSGYGEGVAWVITL